MPAVATFSPSGDAYIDGVLGDYKWAVNSFSYSFPTSGSYYGSGYGSGENVTNFGALNVAQQAAVRSALTMYASVANLGFTETSETASQHADLRFALSDAPSTAWAYFPTTSDEGGDGWFNNSGGSYNQPVKGNYAYMTFIHEIGHALGLEHPHESGMPVERDSIEYTVMSYRSYVGASVSSGYTNETWGYAQSLMMYDIAAVQHMYGANFATNSGNTVYSWSPTTGEMFINGIGQGAAGGNKILLTVWDGGGVDTYDFSNYTTGLAVDLRPGGWTKASTTQLAKLKWDGSKVAVGNIANALLYEGDTHSLIENAKGGSGYDIIKGNQAANTLWGNGGNDKLYGLEGNDDLIGGVGADALDGGTGNDTLYGGAGQDTLIGGSGTDVFMFSALSDTPASARDVIQDFVSGVDKIDLRSIDASTKLAGDQAFAFIGASAFSAAGQLRFSSGVLSGDVNGDKIADFAIHVAGLSVLAKGDFYL